MDDDSPNFKVGKSLVMTDEGSIVKVFGPEAHDFKAACDWAKITVTNNGGTLFVAKLMNRYDQIITFKEESLS